MDEIEFAEHRINASKAVTDSKAFLLTTINSDNKFQSMVQYSSGIEGMALANTLRMYAAEIEHDIFNNTENGDEND